MEGKLEAMNQLYVASRHHLFQTSIATTLTLQRKEAGFYSCRRPRFFDAVNIGDGRYEVVIFPYSTIDTVEMIVLSTS